MAGIRGVLPSRRTGRDELDRHVLATAPGLVRNRVPSPPPILTNQVVGCSPGLTVRCTPEVSPLLTGPPPLGDMTKPGPGVGVQPGPPPGLPLFLLNVKVEAPRVLITSFPNLWRLPVPVQGISPRGALATVVPRNPVAGVARALPAYPARQRATSAMAATNLDFMSPPSRSALSCLGGASAPLPRTYEDLDRVPTVRAGMRRGMLAPHPASVSIGPAQGRPSDRRAEPSHERRERGRWARRCWSAVPAYHPTRGSDVGRSPGLRVVSCPNSAYADHLRKLPTRQDEAGVRTAGRRPPSSPTTGRPPSDRARTLARPSTRPGRYGGGSNGRARVDVATHALTHPRACAADDDGRGQDLGRERRGTGRDLARRRHGFHS